VKLFRRSSRSALSRRGSRVALVAAFVDGLILAWQFAASVLAAALAADALRRHRIASPRWSSGAWPPISRSDDGRR
jgi:hypothetical protein